MKVFLTEVACVGKTSVGAELAEQLGVKFFDFDEEVEKYFAMPVPRIQAKFLTPYSYRKEAAEALKHILSLPEAENCVIAMSPSGLMDNYWRVIKKLEAIKVVLRDKPEAILDRITFYDDDSQLIDKTLSDEEKGLYLREIKLDYTYFRRTYKRADMTVDMSGLGIAETATKVRKALCQLQEDPTVLEGQDPNKPMNADGTTSGGPQAESCIQE